MNTNTVEIFYFIDWFCKHSDRLTAGYRPAQCHINRFVKPQQKATVPVTVFLKMHCAGKRTGVSLINSTPPGACRIGREHPGKVFKGLANGGIYRRAVFRVQAAFSR